MVLHPIEKLFRTGFRLRLAAGVFTKVPTQRRVGGEALNRLDECRRIARWNGDTAVGNHHRDLRSRRHSRDHGATRG